MTKKEKLFTAKLLRLAADEFGNHGCNDVPYEWLKYFTDKEKLKLSAEYYIFNGDPEEWTKETESFDSLPDYCLMSLMAHKLEEENE